MCVRGTCPRAAEASFAPSKSEPERFVVYHFEALRLPLSATCRNTCRFVPVELHQQYQ
jgi:hypothetical protein